MTIPRALWELVTGRLAERVAKLDRDLRSLGDHHNAHVAYARSKLDAVAKHSNETRARLLALASRVEAQPIDVHVELEAFGPDDDEKTVHLDDSEIEVVMPTRRRPTT